MFICVLDFCFNLANSRSMVLIQLLHLISVSQMGCL